MREFFSLDNPKNAQSNDDDDQPGTDESGQVKSLIYYLLFNVAKCHLTEANL